MTRTEIINHFIVKYGYKSYLELGVQDKNNNFNHIRCERKVGVDPTKIDGIYHMTSDDFFWSLERPEMYETFDIIFIDGDHIDTQVLKDFNNSLKYLNPGGTIVLHDCNPQNIKHQMVPRVSRQWNGTVWRAWVEIVKKFPSAYCLNTDEGCGVLENYDLPFKDGIKEVSKIAWPEFQKHQKRFINLIEVEEWRSLQTQNI